MLKKVRFIINPISGVNRRPARIIEWIDRYWGESGIEYEILKTGHRGHGTELARAAASQGCDMVVAAGGDGTINEVGRGLTGTPTALGIIPAGSGNGFARNLGIPLSQKAAIRLLRAPRIVPIDIGKINDRYFFNVAGSGLDAKVSVAFDAFPRRGLLPYVYLSFREYFRFKAEPVNIQLPDRRIRRSPILLTFANLPEFGNNAVIAPGARADDGLLDVCILNPVSLWKLLLNLPRIVSGRIDELAEMEIYQVQRAVITREHSSPIHTDGDPHVEGSTLWVEVVRDGLRVALPDTVAEPVRRPR